MCNLIVNDAENDYCLHRTEVEKKKYLMIVPDQSILTNPSQYSISRTPFNYFCDGSFNTTNETNRYNFLTNSLKLFKFYSFINVLKKYMHKKKLKMAYTSEENEDSSNEDCSMDENSYERTKISNVLVFYVNGKEVRIIIYNFFVQNYLFFMKIFFS